MANFWWQNHLRHHYHHRQGPPLHTLPLRQASCYRPTTSSCKRLFFSFFASFDGHTADTVDSCEPNTNLNGEHTFHSKRKREREKYHLPLSFDWPCESTSNCVCPIPAGFSFHFHAKFIKKQPAKSHRFISFFMSHISLPLPLQLVHSSETKNSCAFDGGPPKRIIQKKTPFHI